jgi:hypothetical protein
MVVAAPRAAAKMTVLRKRRLVLDFLMILFFRVMFVLSFAPGSGINSCVFRPGRR